MKNLVVLAICLVIGLAAQAQEEIMFTASKNSLVDKKIAINKKDIAHKSAKTTQNNIGAFGEALSLNKEENFSGYSIKLLTTEYALEKDANVFYFFGEVTVEQTSKNEFNYIVGQFKTKQDAKKFMDTYLMKHYTKATIIEYKDGKRK